MFGKKVSQPVKKTEVGVKNETPDLVVERPTETVGMRGFTAEVEPEPAPTPTPATRGPPPIAPKVAQVKAPEPAPEIPSLSEHYQIVEIGMSPAEGLYVYKVVTNKYLGELGGVYEA